MYVIINEPLRIKVDLDKYVPFFIHMLEEN